MSHEFGRRRPRFEKNIPREGSEQSGISNSPTNEQEKRGFLFRERFFSKKPLEKENTIEDKAKPSEVKRSYRIQGVFEKASPEIAPLPPTPITEGARDRLKSWGLADDHIEGLQKLTASFRYDLAPQKATEIAKKGAYVYKDTTGKEGIVLPNLSNPDEKLDIQCGAVAKHFIDSLYSSGYLADINEHLQQQGKQPLQPYFTIGKSRTFFNRDSSVHLWAELAHEGEERNKTITIDPSLQEISGSDTILNGVKAEVAHSL